MIWGPSRQCGDDVGTMGTTWVETTGTTWGPSGGYGDDMGTTVTMWGPQGQRRDHGDNKITKNSPIKG